MTPRRMPLPTSVKHLTTYSASAYERTCAFTKAEGSQRGEEWKKAEEFTSEHTHP